MLNRGFLLFFSGLMGVLSTKVASEITAERVLGEYWKDPLFGVAAESHTILVDVLNDRLWPDFIQIPASETIRFVFANRSKIQHLLAFATDMQALQQDETFQKFIADELFHAQQKANHDPRSHSHSSSSVDDAESIVKLLEQRPTVFVKPGETKEILVRFDQTGTVALSCVLDAHNETLINGSIEVIVNE